METVNVPVGYNQIMPYVVVSDAAGFIDLMGDLFAAVEVVRHMRDDNTIMHAEVSFGESVIMLADATADYQVCTAGLFVYVSNADAVYAKALSAGCKALIEPRDQNYGRSGGFSDPYGNTWWITQDNRPAVVA